MPDLLRHVRFLTDKIGGRPATSDAERLASRYLSQTAQEFTPHVWNEPFHSAPSDLWVEGILLGLILTGEALLWRNGLIGMRLLWLAGGVWLLRAPGFLRIGWRFGQRMSQSVVAVVAPRRAIRRRVVLVANYDTVRGAGPGARERQALAVLVGALMVNGLMVAFRPQPFWRWVSLLPALGVLAALVLQIGRDQGWIDRPDRLGNASGVAVALGVGAAIARRPLRYTEVWTLFVGAHDPEMMGMHTFLDRHGALLMNAHWLVLDGIGSGRVRYALRDGLHRSDRGLIRVAHAVAAARPVLGVGRLRRSWRPTSGAVLLRRRFRALTFQADRPEAEPDPVTLDVAVRFLRLLVKQLDYGRPK